MRSSIALIALFFLVSCGGGGNKDDDKDGSGGGGGQLDSVIDEADGGGAASDAGGGGGAVDISGSGEDAGGGGDAVGNDAGNGGGDDAGDDDDAGNGGSNDAGGGGGNDAGNGGGNDSGGGGSDAGGGGNDAGGGNLACKFQVAQGSASATCPAGQQCVVGIGVCAGEVTGVCLTKADVCPAVAQPVCGCDGKNYSNLCEAQKAGAVVDKGGLCVQAAPPCGGIAGIGCPANNFCELDSCAVDALGLCVLAPPAGDCPAGGSEQCGCNGITYASKCARQKASVTLKHVGSCNSDPNAKGCKLGPVKPILCPTDHYCELKVPADCDGEGVCVVKPLGCTKEYQPVCGCNQNTYGNACMAAAAGWNVAKQDPCP